MKHIATLLSALLMITGAQAQERKITLMGTVLDSFTKAPLEAFVTVMTADSTVIDTATCKMWEWGTKHSLYALHVPARQQKFIIKATLRGYHDTYIDYNMKYVARNREFQMPRMLMKKCSDDEDIFAEGTLNDVVVTGTKIKITYRGDTIVYNASAFNLPEGSMLDGLVRQLPGAELKDNGDIYVNGRKIDYLTLNGKDFFKGKNSIMLENLPYFTVQNIEVYNKDNELTRFTGIQIGPKDYVMDVKLKRQYNRGILTNVETGAGTDDRYLARIFSLYYSDHTRLSLFGNTNNFNENRKPGSDGEWAPSNMSQGMHATKQAGISFVGENSEKTYQDQFNGSVQWNDDDNESNSVSERFAQSVSGINSGNIFSGSNSMSRQKSFSFQADNTFNISKPFTAYSYMNLNYDNNRNHSETNDSTWQHVLTNRARNIQEGHSRTLSMRGGIYSYKKFAWGDWMILSIRGNYTNSSPSRNYSERFTYYALTDENDLRSYRTDNHSRSYNILFDVSYTVPLLSEWEIRSALIYEQSLSRKHNMHYHNDINFDEETLDQNNSYSYLTRKKQYTAEVNLISHGKDNKQLFNLSLPIHYTNESINYDAFMLDTIANRHKWIFEPSIRYSNWGGSGYFKVGYDLGVRQPDMFSLMPYINTLNALVTQLNNNRLHSSIEHYFSIYKEWIRDSIQQNINVWGQLTITQNKIGTRAQYNPSTGAYTFMNDNIDGSWETSAGWQIICPIDHKRLFTVRQYNNLSFNHDVDFDIDMTVLKTLEQTPAVRSTVNTLSAEEEFRLTYQKNTLTASISGNVKWRNSTSKRSSFETINAWDFNYGTTLNYTIPVLKIDIATDIKMFSRRGYNSEMMNTDDLVWNASLSKSFYKGQLTAKLTAFDLLHQLSNTTYSVNAQGRNEVRYNCIPRYAMLSIAYKFHKLPKK